MMTTTSTPRNRRTIVVEDDGAVRRAVCDGLAVHGFDAVGVASAEEAIAAHRDTAFDLIVVDVGLPGMSGIELCKHLRDEADDVAILVLSALEHVTDRVCGLRSGADDYVVKPFDLGELAARLDALRRRTRQHESMPAELVVAGPIALDIGRRTVTVDGAAVELTKREFDLLSVLVRNRELVMSRATLLDRVWGFDLAPETNVVDVFIGSLRKKLAAAGAPDRIRTVRGVGFVLRD